MRDYWSNSRIANAIRGTKKPVVLQLDEWDQWNQKAAAAHPIRFWIAEEGLDKVQSFFRWPVDQLYAAKYWINNRFVTKTHTLTSTLNKGEWHEFETRMLHCMFDELVNFVEVEQAWNTIAWNKDSRVKYKAPWYASGWFRWRTWRSPEAGLEGLQWAANLVMDEEWFGDPNHPDINKPTHQAKTAAEVIELYQWWKVTRPARPDPHDASGWTAICEKRRERHGNMSSFLSSENNTEQEKQEAKQALNLTTEIEERYHNEDEQMMIRLIKIRRGLWT